MQQLAPREGESSSSCTHNSRMIPATSNAIVDAQRELYPYIHWVHGNGRKQHEPAVYYYYIITTTPRRAIIIITIKKILINSQQY